MATPPPAARRCRRACARCAIETPAVPPGTAPTADEDQREAELPPADVTPGAPKVYTLLPLLGALGVVAAALIVTVLLTRL